MATKTLTDAETCIRPIHANQGQFEDIKLIWIDERIGSSSDCLHTKQRFAADR